MKYKNEIEKYIDDHKQEMIQDIIRLCEIDSQKMDGPAGVPRRVRGARPADRRAPH